MRQQRLEPVRGMPRINLEARTTSTWQPVRDEAEVEV